MIEGAVRVGIVSDAQKIAEEVQIQFDDKVLVVVPLAGVRRHGVADQFGQTGQRILRRI